jgi:hypothetical protein
MSGLRGDTAVAAGALIGYDNVVAAETSIRRRLS